MSVNDVIARVGRRYHNEIVAQRAAWGPKGPPCERDIGGWLAGVSFDEWFALTEAFSDLLRAADNTNSWLENYPLFDPSDDVFVATVMELRIVLERIGGTALTSISPREPVPESGFVAELGEGAVGSGPGSAPDKLDRLYHEAKTLIRHYEARDGTAACWSAEALRLLLREPCKWPLTECVCGECGP